MAATVPSRPTVVVGADGSPCALDAVRWASDYARRTGAALRVVTAWHWPPSYQGRPTYQGLDPGAEAREVAEKAVAEVTLAPEDVQLDVREGSAGTVLVAASQEPGVVLLAIGKPAGGIPNAAFGSTSLECVLKAICPVIVVR